jgi:hypothetical protein
VRGLDGPGVGDASCWSCWSAMLASGCMLKWRDDCFTEVTLLMYIDYDQVGAGIVRNQAQQRQEDRQKDSN